MSLLEFISIKISIQHFPVTVLPLALNTLNKYFKAGNNILC